MRRKDKVIPNLATRCSPKEEQRFFPRSKRTGLAVVHLGQGVMSEDVRALDDDGDAACHTETHTSKRNRAVD
jgi:hypothetical protein